MDICRIVERVEILKTISRCRVLVVGGGTGGCSVAAKLSFRLGAGNVVVLDAAEVKSFC
jgi:sulfide:quinone oxidoreductase